VAASRPFRFGVQLSDAGSAEEWTGNARRLEDLGYSSLFVPDHFGDQLAPIAALTWAAAATTQLRVGGLVLDNDFRHPLVLAKEAATLDLLSGGRLELGIGAGWMRSDYEISGIPFDEPAVRVERMEEAIAVLKGAFQQDPFSYTGRHYRIGESSPRPRPEQRPHPPVLVGGGGRKVLSVAGRLADIVAVNFNLRAGEITPDLGPDGTAEMTAQKVDWIRQAAGERFDDIELSTMVFVAAVTDDRQSMVDQLAGGFGITPEQALEVPHVLVGTVEEMEQDLQSRRERYGFSYVVLQGMPAAEALAPVVERLSGT